MTPPVKVKKLSEEENRKRNERFYAALQKMTQVSLAYQQNKIKHASYAEQIDALIDASGWSREDFQMEIERRKSVIYQNK